METTMDTPVMEANASRKRSVIVKKRRTSISLEDSFWSSLHAIVRMENITIGDFIERISRSRSTSNLSSSLRVAVLEYYQRLAINNAVIGATTSPPTQPTDEPARKTEAQAHRLESVTGSWNGFERRRHPFGYAEPETNR
jgi:predicted DNA-binding ribbon-helix-helix protein